jgi:acyl carrier protein
MEQEFKEILSQYTQYSVEELTDELRFREDLDLSSLDFMTLLGEVEDTFDITFDKSDANGIFTVGDAIELIRRKKENE